MATRKQAPLVAGRLAMACGLMLMLGACVATRQEPKPAQEFQAMAVKEVVADFKTDAPASFTAATASPSRLVALSSIKVFDFSPVKAPVTQAVATNWFNQPGLTNVEECPHCMAQGNIISSEYGNRRDPKRRGVRLHQGIDIRAPRGSAALAFKGGEVVRASSYSSYGLTVEVRQYDGLMARYAHLNKIMVSKGDIVDAGVQLGEVGTTGRTTGSHLHFELIRAGKSLDPMIYLTRSEQVVRCLRLEASRAASR